MIARRPESAPRPGGPAFMGGGAMGAMGRPPEKAKDFKGTLFRLLGYLSPYRLQIVVVLVFALLSTLFAIIAPKVLGQATTAIFNGVFAKLIAAHAHRPPPSLDFGYIKEIAAILIVLYVVSAVFNYAQQYIMAGVAQKIVYALRRDVDAKLERLPLKFFDARTHGEILSRVTNDIDTIATTLQQSMTQLITSVVTIVGVIIMMLTISPVLTLVVLIPMPL